MGARATTVPTRFRDLVSLTKPRITLLVLCTTAGGIFLAPGSLTTVAIVVTLLATALTVGAANTLNCYLEREIDGLMRRTRNRPLPAGRVDPRTALALGLCLAAVSIPLLTFVINPVTGLLAAIALGSYVLIYTPLKQRTPLALIVGAVPGAIPPLMGWTAVTGSVDLPALALFGILFIWQVPHFLAIALYQHADYFDAGFKTFPVNYGARTTRVHMFVWSLCLVPMTIAPYLLGGAGVGYLVVAAVLGAAFVVICARGLGQRVRTGWARRVFAASIPYLAVLFAALIIDAR